MTAEDKIAKAEKHLREVWETLLRERQQNLARAVEGVLAELTDEALDATERLQSAVREWRAINQNPRGLPDWGVWREDEAHRLQLNRVFEGHREAVDHLLR